MFKTERFDTGHRDTGSAVDVFVFIVDVFVFILLVILLVGSATGTTVAQSMSPTPNADFNVTKGENTFSIKIEDPGNLDTLQLFAPDGTRSTEATGVIEGNTTLRVSDSPDFSTTVVDPENLNESVRAEDIMDNILAFGYTVDEKTFECVALHDGYKYSDGTSISSSQNHPCHTPILGHFDVRGELNVNPSVDIGSFENGEPVPITYQEGTYELVGTVDGNSAVVETVTVENDEDTQSEPNCSTVTYPGAGTNANPYEVSNVDQLQCIENQGLDANYIVVSDIDASETISWNGGSGFDPIGGPPVPTSGPSFDGTFVGKGHNITNLTINRDDKKNVGLFGGVGRSGEIMNVSVVDAKITGYEDVGSLVGLNAGTVDESYAIGSINGSSSVGGLVGRTRGESTVSESYATASVSGNQNVGGLVGEGANDDTVISRSYAKGEVEGTEDVGGLIGSTSGTVSKSYAMGLVDGSNRVGGLVGFNVREGTVSESYATGLVEGSNRVGGLVGLNAQGTVSESYWDIQTTGQSTSGGGGTGLTTSNMTGSAATGNMLDFDFTDTWETVTNPDDYPILIWQTQTDDNTPPTASFTFTPSSPSTSDTVSFDASGSNDPDGSIQRYEWDFGDGNTATGQSVSHSYSSSGTYTVELTVEDDSGGTNTTTRTISVRSGELFTEPLPGFNSQPTDTEELDSFLYEDVDGDGDGTDTTQSVLWWSRLIQTPEEFDALTQEQIEVLDWSGDGELTPEDAVMLWSEQIQSGR